MDATAHRTIHAARSMLVDDLGGCTILPAGTAHDDWPTVARTMGHGLNADQAQQLVGICSQLMSLMIDDPAPPECQECATPIVQYAGTFSARRYCSNACRQAAYRSRGGAIRSTAPTDPPYAGAEWCTLCGTWTGHRAEDHDD